MSKKLDLTGKKIGKLSVLRSSRTKSGRTSWVCLCECGKKTNSSTSHLRSGHAKSCGCLITDILIKRNKTHGAFLSKDKNEMKLYYAWQGILKRCYNQKEPGYKNYGGRGIKVCKRWENSFENFRNDTSKEFKLHIKKFGVKNTLLDRINNNGNYEPSNVRWVVRNIQNKNKRNVKNITWRGQTKCVADWAKFLGTPKSSLWQRLYKYKLGVEEAFNQSIKFNKLKINI